MNSRSFIESDFTQGQHEGGFWSEQGGMDRGRGGGGGGALAGAVVLMPAYLFRHVNVGPFLQKQLHDLEVPALGCGDEAGAAILYARSH